VRLVGGAGVRPPGAMPIKLQDNCLSITTEVCFGREQSEDTTEVMAGQAIVLCFSWACLSGVAQLQHHIYYASNSGPVSHCYLS